MLSVTLALASMLKEDIMAIRRDTPELPQAILLEDDGIVTRDNGPVLQPANLTAVAQPVITNRFVLTRTQIAGERLLFPAVAAKQHLLVPLQWDDAR